MSMEEQPPQRPPQPPPLRTVTSLSTEVGEKKINLRRIASEVGTMAAELNRVRGLVASHEAALHQESSKRQAAEANARDMAKQLEKMHSSLQDSNLERQSSALVAKQSLEELMEVTDRLSEAEEITEATSSFSSLLRVQCETLCRELDQKNLELEQQKAHMGILEQKHSDLESELKKKEIVQKELRHQICDLETQVDSAMNGTYASKESKFQKLLSEVSVKNIEHLEKHLMTKDHEIARLRQEVTLAYADAKLRGSEFSAKIEKHQIIDQELQQKIAKLEFCLDEARKQIRKLKKNAEKEQENLNSGPAWLRDSTSPADSHPKFWHNFKFPCLLSMSAVAVVFIVKR